MNISAPHQNYDHKTRESHWQRIWEEKGIYAWRGDQPRDETYVIDTPPPTVSGHLHMGHIFSYTHADFIARYQRMKGKDVFYPMGFDDNGLPTERLVEKTKKVRATDMSREAFIGLCEEVSREARGEFRALFTSTALSVDWRQEYHTISEHARRVSQASFIDLYNKGQVYRKLQPMLWDPVDQTAIAQAEVEDKEMSGVFCDIRFCVEGGGEFIIGTTRPEMLPACVAIFYHPDDARYAHLKGKFAITPLFGMRVPILEDDTVEPDKGTGIMMCCTFGDEADIVKWRKHGLDTKIILNKYGKIEIGSITATDLTISSEDYFKVVEQIKGLKATVAREKTIEMLRDSGDLVDVKPITHAVKCAERSGAPLEILPTQQWFVNVLEHKAALKEKSAQCDWKPEWMAKRMEQWIDGLNWDWCISRQRYYGVPFPVLYAKEVKFSHESKISNRDCFKVVGEQFIILPKYFQLPFNPLDSSQWIEVLKENGYELFDDLQFEGSSSEHGVFPTAKDPFMDGHRACGAKKDGLVFVIAPDADVMDTWATSSLSPQISAWGFGCHPERSEGSHNKDSSASPQNDTNNRFHQLFPADLRPQAHEIIRTWAFYTLAKAHLHHDSIPWKNLMISGWCLAADKTKMSKSKGNVVTPAGLLETHSADAVRYWASTSRLGSDTAFSEDVLKIGRKLVNKLWNASKFVMGMMEAASVILSVAKDLNIPDSSALPQNDSNYPLDKWMISRIHHAITQADACFAAYDYAGARATVEDVFWNDFCDNYLELVKMRAYGNMGEAGQASAIATLSASLNALLKLFAPFVPHITEELYHLVYPQEAAMRGSIHARGNFPDALAYPQDNVSEAAGEAAVAVLELIRKAKSERGVSIKYPIEMAYLTGADESVLEGVMDDVKAAGTVAQLCFTVSPSPSDCVLHDEARGYTLEITFAAEANVA